MQLLDGKACAQAYKSTIAQQVLVETSKGIRKPHLAAILVGNDGASETYIASKVKTCAELGYESTLLRFESNVSEAELLNAVYKFNANASIDGILVQLPLPAHINSNTITLAIDPAKDVDGFHPENLGRMMLGLPSFIPATPKGIMMLLEHNGIRTAGMHAVVLGRSHIVGSPLSVLLARNAEPGNCTVTLCHSKTKNIQAILMQADLLVAALGKPEFVKADMVKDGAIVVDVGITRISDTSSPKGYTLKGDVAFEEVRQKASWITPVPGGVGAMTIAALMQNTFEAWSRNTRI
ncbi:MAG: bifunctional 5,10-methylenetetrahydrofolate dehydrogenase/5,10-methenyltetrahydrofolate cyclohydrolase [Bacteroidia bacterium]|jgi:methylenetetrahydrofolate dehydrogenase (NADP+)/methenyltetrahydrofolate cyclohydrolase